MAKNKNGTNGKNGRPPSRKRSLTKADLIMVRRMAALGMTQDQIAYILADMKGRAFRKWLTELPELAEAYKTGCAEGTRTVASMLMDKVNEGNLSAIVFWLKTKGGFNTPKEALPAQTVAVVNATDKPRTIEALYEHWGKRSN